MRDEYNFCDVFAVFAGNPGTWDSIANAAINHDLTPFFFFVVILFCPLIDFNTFKACFCVNPLESLNCIIFHPSG